MMPSLSLSDILALGAECSVVVVEEEGYVYAGIHTVE